MSIEKRKYPETNKYYEYNQANKNIEKLTLKYLGKYSKNKELLEELAKFETKKGLEKFKEYISNLENFKITKDINIENLFNDLQKLKKEIAQLTKKNLDSLKNNLKKETFSPNKNYDLANNIKNKFPNLYSKIINPKNFIDNSIGASLGLANSLYKIGISIKKISLDLIKLLTFQTNLKEIKELYKKV